MLNIAFRADSSGIIGTGHIMRCLTLANALIKRCPANIYFFTRKADGNINNLIVDSGFKLLEMHTPMAVSKGRLAHSDWLGASQKEDVQEFLQLRKTLAINCFDYLIIDHYAIDKTWQKYVKNHAKKIMVIDDLGDRFHQCHYLLDQTYNCPTDKYAKLVPSECQLLLGTKFALLRKEFQAVKNIPKNTKHTNILVMFGGTDPNNLTKKVLQLLCMRNDLNKITVILGATAVHIHSVKKFINKQTKNNQPIFNLHVNPTNIAQLMRDSTLAIGAAGTTSWERCAIGLPAVVVIQADNQKQIAIELEKSKVISYLEAKKIKCLLNKQVTTWLENPIKYQIAVEHCYHICDGFGAFRVVERIIDNGK